MVRPGVYRLAQRLEMMYSSCMAMSEVEAVFRFYTSGWFPAQSCCQTRRERHYIYTPHSNIPISNMPERHPLRFDAMGTLGAVPSLTGMLLTGAR